MKKAARFISLVICLVMVLPLAPQAFADSDLLYPVTVTVSIGDGKEYIVRGYDVTHENNLYLSLNDLAAVLKTTEKKFTVQFQNSSLHHGYRIHPRMPVEPAVLIVEYGLAELFRHRVRGRETPLPVRRYMCVHKSSV